MPDPLRLSFLPAYRPERSPVEHVCEHWRENHFGNDTCAMLEAVGNRLATRLGTLAEPPERVRSRTCFDQLETPSLASNYCVLHW